MLGATLKKNLKSPMPKQSNDSAFKKTKSSRQIQVFVACQIDVANK